jgi:sucrose-6-phosphate hydrolase SacC (GH32 family)
LVIRGEPVTFSQKQNRLSCLGKSAPVELVNGRLWLQVLVDRTSLEVFANDGRVSMTSCFLPRLKDRSLQLYARGGTARLVSLQLFELRSAW